MKKIIFLAIFSISQNLWPQSQLLFNAKSFSPDLIVEMRYFRSYNFIGKKIVGYQANKCLLSEKAAKQIAKVQLEAKSLGYSLKVYDCYRPQRSVDMFVKWAQNLSDQKMKRFFYPRVEKDVLLQGYIASRSGHSRGSTIDLTLVKLPYTPSSDDPFGSQFSCMADSSLRYDDHSIDMGTSFDCFDELSHTENPNISKDALQNRLLLRKLMNNHGLVNYSKEWWHYSLKDEPFPHQYFDIIIK